MSFIEDYKLYCSIIAKGIVHLDDIMDVEVSLLNKLQRMNVLLIKRYANVNFWTEYIEVLKKDVLQCFQIEEDLSLGLIAYKIGDMLKIKYALKPYLKLEEVDRYFKQIPFPALHVKAAKTYMRRQVTQEFFQEVLLHELSLRQDVLSHFQERLDSKTRLKNGFAPIPTEILEEITQKYIQLKCYLGLQSSHTVEEVLSLMDMKEKETPGWHPGYDYDFRREYKAVFYHEHEPNQIYLKFRENTVDELELNSENPLGDFLLLWVSLRIDPEGKVDPGYMSSDISSPFNSYLSPYEEDLETFLRLESLSSPYERYLALRYLDLSTPFPHALTEIDGENWKEGLKELDTF